MNNPEYILVDVIGEVVEATRVAMNIPVLNYQYGYIRELNETLNQDAMTRGAAGAADLSAKRYPLIWFAQPFFVERDIVGYYGWLRDGEIFIINGTQKDWKAKDRMTNNFKPIIYPIYRELLKQFHLHPAFSAATAEALQVIKHNFIDRYFFGEEQQNIINDAVDCSIITDLELLINDNQNCLTVENTPFFI